MKAVEAACVRIVSAIPGAVACGVVQFEGAKLLGVHNEVTGKSTLDEVVVTGLVDMFRAPKIAAVERGVRAQRHQPEDGQHYFQEIQIVSRHNLHFAKASEDGRLAVMLITRKTTDKELAWSVVRDRLKEIEAIARDG